MHGYKTQEKEEDLVLWYTDKTRKREGKKDK